MICMQILFPIVLFVYLLFPSAGFAAPAGDISIVTPLEGSFVESGLVSIVLTAPRGGLDEVRISVGRENYSFKRPADKGYVCCGGIRVARGMNQLGITLFKRGEAIAEKKLNVFFRSDLSAIAANPPRGSRKFIFHLPEQEKRCAPCHPMNFSRDDENPKTPQQSGCFTCHRKITAGKLVHPPADEWSCVICHTVKSKQGGGSTLEADGSSCSKCHWDTLGRWSKKEFRHGPSDAGHCTACHDPHASDQPGFLHMNATDICASCHEEVMARPHVIAAVSSREGHPVRISPDPFRPGRDFTCASCHNPHAGDAPNFLNNYQASMPVHLFCLSCHKL